MDINRISGYIPGKMVFFLMQVRGGPLGALASALAGVISNWCSPCKSWHRRVAQAPAGLGCSHRPHSCRPTCRVQVCRAGTGRPRRIWLTRHGESEFNVLGKVGGNSALSPRCAPPLPACQPPEDGPFLMYAKQSVLGCKCARCFVHAWWLMRLCPPHQHCGILAAYFTRLLPPHPCPGRGQMYARLLPDILMDRVPTTLDGTPLPVAVWTSTLQRTILTAAGLPFPKLQWKALDEIQVRVCVAGWAGCPGRCGVRRLGQAGESCLAVSALLLQGTGGTWICGGSPLFLTQGVRFGHI